MKLGDENTTIPGVVGTADDPYAISPAAALWQLRRQPALLLDDPSEEAAIVQHLRDCEAADDPSEEAAIVQHLRDCEAADDHDRMVMERSGVRVPRNLRRRI